MPMVPVCNFLNLSIVFASVALDFRLRPDEIESFFAKKRVVFGNLLCVKLRTPFLIAHCLVSTSTVSHEEKHIKTRQIISDCLLAPLRFRFHFHVNRKKCYAILEFANVALAKAGCMQI